MPRRARHEVPAGAYHVTSRGVAKEAVFLDDDDRAFFLSFLARVAARERWRCLAYCLMTTHYHLVASVPANTMTRGMHWLNGMYAITFNRKHRRRGHLFGDRFRLTSVETDEHLEHACLYVVANPVRAGLCAHPRDWPWSSYRASVGDAPAPPFLNVGAFRSS